MCVCMCVFGGRGGGVDGCREGEKGRPVFYPSLTHDP